MILPVISIIVGLACFFTALSFWREGVLNSVLACVMWVAAGAGSFGISIPYQVYSTAENAVVTGVQTFAGAEAMTAWLFILIGLVMLFHAMVLFFKGRVSA